MSPSRCGTGHAFHTCVRRHVLPRPDELRPVLYNSWEAASFQVCGDNQVAPARRAAALGVELFVVDDGWFGGRDGGRAGLGDWRPHRRRFPRGLRPPADEVHRLGMAFRVWVEPETVSADSDLYRRRPEWAPHLPDRSATGLRHRLVLDFSRRDVADWAYEWLCDVAEDNDVDFLKWDFNRSFTEAGVHEDGPDVRRVYTEHARGPHRVLGRLRRAVPHLRVEGCAGGGGRIDLGVLARIDQVWTSDNTDAVDRLTIRHGFGRIRPAGVMPAWVTDSPNPLTGRRVPLAFRFHSATAGVLGIGGDLTGWTEQETAEAARLVELYKDIRPVVRHGRPRRLLAPGEGSLTTVQSTGAGADRTVVLVRRPSTSFGTARPRWGCAVWTRGPVPGRGHRGGAVRGDADRLRPPGARAAVRRLRERAGAAAPGGVAAPDGRRASVPPLRPLERLGAAQPGRPGRGGGQPALRVPRRVPAGVSRSASASPRRRRRRGGWMLARVGSPPWCARSRWSITFRHRGGNQARTIMVA
jgi:alpha-galactosidase